MQLEHHFEHFVAHFSAPTRPHTRCGPCSAWRPDLPHADWCLQSDIMPDLGAHFRAEKGSLSWRFAPYGGVALQKHHTTSIDPVEKYGRRRLVLLFVLRSTVVLIVIT